VVLRISCVDAADAAAGSRRANAAKTNVVRNFFIFSNP
jgi:hypothetical protein